MNRREILRELAEVVREHLEHGGELSPEMDLIEDLELDSLRLLTLAVEVENHFRICLDQKDEAAIRTVADLVAVVERKLAEATD